MGAPKGSTRTTHRIRVDYVTQRNRRKSVVLELFGSSVEAMLARAQNMVYRDARRHCKRITKATLVPQPPKLELVEIKPAHLHAAFFGTSEELPIEVGEVVEKQTGDYRYRGEVRGVITKRNGQTRYVVENADGMLFIFNRSQLVVVG